MATTFTPTNRPVDVNHYKIQLSIDPSTDPKDFSAQTEVRLKATAPIDSFTLDIDGLQIEKVTLLKPSKKTLEFTAKETTLQVTLPKKFKKGETLAVVIDYKGKINTAHSGLFKVQDPDEPGRGPLLFTHFEATSARAFFPCNDEPYDKASTEVVVQVPKKYDVLSNGKKLADKKIKRDKADWHEVQWKLEKPHPTYLVALAIGPFAKISTKHGAAEVSVYVGDTKKEQAKYALDSTKSMLEFFDDYLGVKYPWPQYATVGLPTFLWGGMENTSTTHMNQERTVLNDPSSEFDKKRIVGLAAHELAHQWFGDLVTMKWWDDLWLNEAFASYFGTMATRHIFKNEEAELEVVVDTWDDYMRQENGPRSHPIVDKALTSADDAFDAISYTKGENVLRMLNFYVGEAKFRKGVKNYLTRHAYSNATYQDFFDEIAKVSKEDLSKFRDSWLLQRGYPVVAYSGKFDSTKKTYQLTLNQHSNHAEDKSLFTFRIPVVLHRKANPAYSKELTMDVGAASTSVEVAVPAEPDWVSVNTGAVVLAKIVQEKRDEELLATQATNDPDPFTRVWASYELMQGLLDGSGLSRFSEQTLVDVLSKDPSPYARIAVLSAFSKMKTRWLPEKLGNTVYDLAQAATSGKPERQVAATQDPHGWNQWRSKLYGSLGRVNRPEILPFLASVLGRNSLAIDDLGESALSVAAIGDEKSAGILKSALKVHENRGYRYRFLIQYAFGAYENVAAAAEIKEIAKTCGSDYIGRVGWLVADNQTLKNSSEWASFLQDFILNNDRFGDEVKARIMRTIEEVKTPEVKSMLEAIVKESSSERMREVCKKILDKNFAPRVNS